MTYLDVKTLTIPEIDAEIARLKKITPHKDTKTITFKQYLDLKNLILEALK